MASAIDKLLVEQIATKGELKNCDDMIPVRYNGRPGENLAFLNRKGGDYRWFGKKRDEKTGQWIKYESHPVFVRNDGRAVVPNLPENVKILEEMKPQPTFERVVTAEGHKQVRGPDHPPLYERLKGTGAAISLSDLSEADQEALAEMVLKKMEKSTAPAPATDVVLDAPKPAAAGEEKPKAAESQAKKQ